MRAELQATLSKWLDRLTRSRFDWSELSKRTSTGPNILAFSPPAYLGVTESTRRFFPDGYGLAESDLLLASDRRAFVAALVATAPDAVVFSGFCDGYREVLEDFRAARSETPVYVLWHASPLQLALREERRQFDSILELTRRGVVSRMGFFKTGEGEALSRLGVDAVDVFNLPPPGPPQGERDHSGAADRGTQGSLRLGIFSAGPSWRKNPYAMIAAAARLDSVVLSGVLDEEARRYAIDLGLGMGNVREGFFDRPTLEQVAGQMDVNLYIGLSECSPLFPLESLHWGVPCLIGATSHLFAASPVEIQASGSQTHRVSEAADLLDRRLVVTRADDPVAIAQAIEGAVSERQAIGTAYRDWVESYREAAWLSMESLVGLPLDRGVSE